MDIRHLGEGTQKVLQAVQLALYLGLGDAGGNDQGHAQAGTLFSLAERGVDAPGLGGPQGDLGLPGLGRGHREHEGGRIPEVLEKDGGPGPVREALERTYL